MSEKESLLLDEYKLNILPKLKELKEDPNIIEYVVAAILINFYAVYGYVPEA